MVAEVEGKRTPVGGGGVENQDAVPVRLGRGERDRRSNNSLLFKQCKEGLLLKLSHAFSYVL